VFGIVTLSCCNNLSLQNIDSSPVSFETNPIICCTDPTQTNIDNINFYNKTIEQHINQHIEYIDGNNYNIDVPILINNIHHIFNLNFKETITHTIGIPFKYNETNKKLFELFENNDIIASWGNIFTKHNIKNKIIFVKIENQQIIEIYLIENDESNSIFDNTFKSSGEYFMLI